MHGYESPQKFCDGLHGWIDPLKVTFSEGRSIWWNMINKQQPWSLEKDHDWTNPFQLSFVVFWLSSAVYVFFCRLWIWMSWMPFINPPKGNSKPNRNFLGGWLKTKHDICHTNPSNWINTPGFVKRFKNATLGQDELKIIVEQLGFQHITTDVTVPRPLGFHNQNLDSQKGRCLRRWTWDVIQLLKPEKS